MALPEHPGNEEGWNGHGNQCTATSHRTGVRCKGPAIRGLTVCRTHGGNAPAARAAAARRVAEHEAELKALRLAERYEADIDPDADMVDHYRRLLATALAWNQICEQLIAELPAIDYTTAAGEKKLQHAVSIFERSLDRAEKFLNNAQHLNLEERNTRAREAQVIALGTLWRTWSQDLLHHIAHRIAHHDDATAIMADITTDAEALAKQHLNAKT